jgi:hypothetical protein
MGEMEELAEKIEEAAHEGHGHGHEKHGEKPGKPGIAKYIGLTMAVLGVLLAVCSAMVGGSRTDLIATMVEQTATSNQYQSIAMKYRTLMAQLQQLHALLPSDPHEFAAADNQIVTLENSATADGAPSIKVVRLEADKILNTVTPTGSDVLRFVSLVRDYDKEREVAKKWTESYEDEIHAYSEATEHYEWGQLCAEFGIVLASIALLLNSRLSWTGSMIMGAASASIVLWAYTSSHAELVKAGSEITEAKKVYHGLKMEEQQAHGDEELLKDIERIEAPVASAERAAAAAPHATASSAPTPGSAAHKEGAEKPEPPAHH